MRPARLLAWLGAALLVAAFAFAGLNVLRRSTETAGPSGVRVVRVAHWQLEPGLAEAFDAVARAYEARHPGVRIEQLRVPSRVFANWVTTQLVGGTAPDLIAYSTSFGINTERLARFFLPISAEVELPNPYNAGTPLEGVPWRSTFLDGLEGGFDNQLYDFYGIPIFRNTHRLYFNRDLLKRVTGSDQPPQTFEELLRLAPLATRHAALTGHSLHVLAGSGDSLPGLIDQLCKALTQRWILDQDRSRRIQPDMLARWQDHLEGHWNLGDPAWRAALSALRDLSSLLPPGALQLNRDDAIFQFVQGKALLFLGPGTFASSLEQQAEFRMGVTHFPTPLPDSTRYPGLALGANAEGGSGTFGPLALFRGSRHPEQAIDFLRFASSVEGTRILVEASGWPPVIAAVPPRPGTEVFLPRHEGAAPGVSLYWGNEITAAIRRHWHHLFAPHGSIDAFVVAVADELPAAARVDLERSVRNRLQFLRVNDAVAVALSRLEASETDPERRAALARRRESVLLAQVAQETEAFRLIGAGLGPRD